MIFVFFKHLVACVTQTGDLLKKKRFSRYSFCCLNNSNSHLAARLSVHFLNPLAFSQSMQTIWTEWIKDKLKTHVEEKKMPWINHEHNQSAWHMAVTPWPQNVCSLRISKPRSQLVRSSILSGMTDLKIYRKCAGILSTGSDSLIMCHSPRFYDEAVLWERDKFINLFLLYCV